ncbi:MAG: DUF975 family protein [Clostridiales bacterium]|nr:DUF975 family protein [Clostridiales bacterium]
MLRARDFRQRAWSALSGKWGTMIVIMLIVSLISGACGGLTIIGVGAIVLLLITGPLSLGVAGSCLRVVRGQSVEVSNTFDGFKNFGGAFLLSLLNSIFIALWSLLFIIPGIIKSYAYSMSFYILNDNPQMDANTARKRSIEMMRGNKWRLFCLDLSFIGWWILCILTLGILSFWVEPYQKVAYAEFYQSLLAEQSSDFGGSYYGSGYNANGGYDANGGGNTSYGGNANGGYNTDDGLQKGDTDDSSPFSADDL